MIRLSFAIAATVALAAAGAAITAPQFEAAGWLARDLRYPGVIELALDTSDVERGIFRVRQRIPVASAGPFTCCTPSGCLAITRPRHSSNGWRV